LGLFDVTMAAAGAMVGAGIFLLVGATFSVAGSWAVVSLALAAFLALLAGTAYAELASGRPDASGGAYVWVKSALPAPGGFLSGWLSWSGAMATSALCALGLGLFLLEIVQPSASYFTPSPTLAAPLGAAILAFASISHFARIHLSARAIGRLTLVKLVLIVLLAGIGLASLPASGPFPPTDAPGSVGVVLGAGIFFIAFQGFEVVAQLSDQAKAPERTIPRGMFLAVALALGVYVLFFVSLVGNVPQSYLANWPSCGACQGASEDMFFAGVANFALGHPFVRVALLVLGVVSLYGALNASLSSAIRTSFSMSRDGLLPGILGKVGSQQMPPVALALTAVGSALLLILNLETIAILAGLAFLGLFAFVQASVIALRHRERRSAPGFRMPLVPALPVFAIALDLAVGGVLWKYPATGGSIVALPAGDVATYVGALWLAVGLIYHYFTGGRDAVRKAQVAPRTDVSAILTTQEDHVELERYRVFLPLREFEDAELVGFGARVARARNGELSLLNVVEIPRNLPPKAIRFRYVDDRIRGLQKLAKVGAQLGVDTRPVVKIGYKVYEIILDTIKDEAVNLLVMGWRGTRTEGDRRILGSNIDYLIENAPCDVVVFKTQGLQRPLKKIVILTSPIWTIQSVGDLALILAEEDRAAIQIVSFVRDPAEGERLKQDASEFVKQSHALDLPVDHKILYSTQWEPAAVQESAEASLLMIRAMSPGGLRKFSLSPVEDRIVKLAKCPVLILRKGVA
jgi:amino acid transporter/nucleotide-binding universal stress UspA family protein